MRKKLLKKTTNETSPVTRKSKSIDETGKVKLPKSKASKVNEKKSQTATKKNEDSGDMLIVDKPDGKVDTNKISPRASKLKNKKRSPRAGKLGRENKDIGTKVNAMDSCKASPISHNNTPSIGITPATPKSTQPNILKFIVQPQDNASEVKNEKSDKLNSIGNNDNNGNGLLCKQSTEGDTSKKRRRSGTLSPASKANGDSSTPSKLCKTSDMGNLVSPLQKNIAHLNLSACVKKDGELVIDDCNSAETSSCKDETMEVDSKTKHNTSKVTFLTPEKKMMDATAVTPGTIKGTSSPSSEKHKSN